MDDFILVNIEDLGREVGVPVQKVFSPDGKHEMMLQAWSKPYLAKALEKADGWKGQKIILTGHVDPWVTMAILDRIAPADVRYRVPMGDTELYPLAHGAPNPELDTVFAVQEDGDNVYINFNSDKEGAEGHTFQIEDISRIVVPDIPAGKNIFFHGLGMYPVQIVVLNELAKTCGSLSTACHADPVYTCAISRNGSLEPGDTTIRV